MSAFRRASCARSALFRIVDPNSRSLDFVPMAGIKSHPEPLGKSSYIWLFPELRSTALGIGEAVRSFAEIDACGAAWSVNFFSITS